MIKGKEFAEKYFSQTEESEKLFSTGNSELDSLLEEVYYSGIEDGYDYAQKEFASKSKVWDAEDEEEDKKAIDERKKRSESRKGRKLEDSHRGLGRSLILGGGLPGAISAYTTKSDADKDYKEGYSEDEIVRRAGQRGAKRGAIIGGAAGLVGGVARSAQVARIAKSVGLKSGGAVPAVLVSTAAGAGWGALGSHLGAKKNAKTRLEKSRKSDD